MNETPFGDLINQWRIAKRMTLRDVAEEVGVSPIHICDIEHGKRNPSRALAERLCSLFEMQEYDVVVSLLQAKFQRAAGDEFAVEVRRR